MLVIIENALELEYSTDYSENEDSTSMFCFS